MGTLKELQLPDVNINTGAQSINTERASLNQLTSIDKNHECLQAQTN